jgi:GNAT superfamily N-acetyltransferase
MSTDLLVDAALTMQPARAHPATPAQRPFHIRRVSRRDLDAIVAIDQFHSGEAKRNDWAAKLSRRRSGEPGAHVGFVAGAVGRVIGYIFVEARAWEFGSPLCGWITAIGVDPEHVRTGVAFALCQEACGWLRAHGIASVRTMVRRDAVEVLSFFRASGFRGGPYLELELDL